MENKNNANLDGIDHDVYETLTSVNMPERTTKSFQISDGERAKLENMASTIITYLHKENSPISRLNVASDRGVHFTPKYLDDIVKPSKGRASDENDEDHASDTYGSQSEKFVRDMPASNSLYDSNSKSAKGMKLMDDLSNDLYWYLSRRMNTDQFHGRFEGLHIEYIKRTVYPTINDISFINSDEKGVVKRALDETLYRLGNEFGQK